MKTKTLFAAMLLCAGCIIPNADPEDCVSKDCVCVTIAGKAYYAADSDNNVNPLLLNRVDISWIDSSGWTAYGILSEYIDSSNHFSFNTTIDTSYFDNMYQLRVTVWTKFTWWSFYFDHFDRIALQDIVCVY
jgi:hypothetical protein